MRTFPGEHTTRSVARICLLVTVAAVGLGGAPVRAADPLLRLDPARHGPGTLLVALEELEPYRPPQAVELVLPLLAHPEPEVARTAGWLLRRMGRGPEGAEAAAAVLADAEADAPARLSAAVGLGALRDASGVAALSRALSNDPAPPVRAAAARALGALHRAGAVDALVQAASGDSDEEVRAAAARALGSVPDGRPEGLAAVLQDTDQPAGVRVEAAWSLGRHRFSEAIGHLQNALSDRDCRVGAAAAWALARIGDPSVVAALEAAASGPCRLTSQAAAWALSEISH